MNMTEAGIQPQATSTTAVDGGAAMSEKHEKAEKISDEWGRKPKDAGWHVAVARTSHEATGLETIGYRNLVENNEEPVSAVTAPQKSGIKAKVMHGKTKGLEARAHGYTGATPIRLPQTRDWMLACQGMWQRVCRWNSWQNDIMNKNI